MILIFLVNTFSWWFFWSKNRWSYLTGRRITWITWIKYCCYKFQCFYLSKPFTELYFLVILVFRMFDTYIWWIIRFPILSIYKFYSYFSKMFFFWERESACFFFTSVVWMTIHKTAIKNHRMYRVVQNLQYN